MTVAAMDDARTTLHAAIRQELTPKMKEQETRIATLQKLAEDLSGVITERTAEKALVVVHLRETMEKLEFYIGEKRIADAQVMKLEGDVKFLKAHNIELEKGLTQALCAKIATRKNRELIHLKGKGRKK
jgi:uncharacterized coiled-coil protein SlyX